MSELGQPVKSFADTFSAETVIMETFFPDQIVTPIPDPEIWFDDAGWFLHHPGTKKKKGYDIGPFITEDELLEFMELQFILN